MSALGQPIEPYEVAVSDATPDSEWDAFVAARPGCPYVQSSAWAQVKAGVGWRARRVVVRRKGEVVGGCQLFFRSLRVLGSVAYGPRAPLSARDEPSALSAVLRGVDELGRAERVLYCKLQPPGESGDLAAALEQRGWVESGLEAGTTATVRVDLRADPEELLRRMRASVRRNIRRAERSGVRVRVDGAAGLSAFWKLVSATSRRQRFSPYPEEYYRTIWRTFSELGEVALVAAEHDGELLASHLLVGFGDTVVYKMGAWSGLRAELRPNELAQWTALGWARERGYAYYDFDGIDLDVAEALSEGAPPPERENLGVTGFKLGFGGDVVIFPAAYDRSYRALLARPVRWVAPRLRPGRLAGRIAGRGG